MSDSCDDCGWHTLECICGSGCPCRQSDHYTHLNAVRKSTGVRDVKWVNVRGRSEHEAVLLDKDLCNSLGLDQAYEIMVYLKRWGRFLCEKEA